MRKNVPNNTSVLRVASYHSTTNFFPSTSLPLLNILLLAFHPSNRSIGPRLGSSWSSNLRLLGRVASLAGEPAVAVFTTYVITLAIYPGFIFGIAPPAGFSAEQAEWWGIGLVTNFAVFDYLGRHVAAHVAAAESAKGVLRFRVMYLARTAFIPLAYAVHRGEAAKVVGMTLLVAGLSFTNGVVGTMAMMRGPEQMSEEADEEARHLAGFFMTWSLVSGLAVGGGLGNAVAANL
mmetsp:Transcript_28906/g.72591  ORF Transcript_28906/g.72591 Transcript_28906/m.72591 type:complete len:234 (-) Transcript_28906:468-1169(-)